MVVLDRSLDAAGDDHRPCLAADLLAVEALAVVADDELNTVFVGADCDANLTGGGLTGFFPFAGSSMPWSAALRTICVIGDSSSPT